MWFPPAVVVVGKWYLRVVRVERFAPSPRHHRGHEHEDSRFDDLRTAFLRQFLHRLRGFFDAFRRVDDVEDHDVRFLQRRVDGFQVGFANRLRDPFGLLALWILLDEKRRGRGESVVDFERSWAKDAAEL